MRLSLLVSTRKRPQLLLNMWKTANERRAKLPPFSDPIDPVRQLYKHELELVLYVDTDDIETRNIYYEKIVSKYTNLITGPRPDILGETTNKCLKGSTGEICMLCTDDVVFHTEGWDDIVVQEFEKYPDRIVMVYGEDGHQHGRIATLPFLHRNWLKTIGRFLPTYFVNEFGDLWLTQVASGLGRLVYIPGLLIQHLSTFDGTMGEDSTFTERRQMRQRSKSEVEWNVLYEGLARERQKEVNRLNQFITEFASRK